MHLFLPYMMSSRVVSVHIGAAAAALNPNNNISSRWFLIAPHDFDFFSLLLSVYLSSSFFPTLHTHCMCVCVCVYNVIVPGYPPLPHFLSAFKIFNKLLCVQRLLLQFKRNDSGGDTFGGAR